MIIKFNVNLTAKVAENPMRKIVWRYVIFPLDFRPLFLEPFQSLLATIFCNNAIKLDDILQKF